MQEQDLYSRDPATTLNRVVKVLSELGERDHRINLCMKALSRSEVDIEEKEEARRKLIEQVLALDEVE